MFDYSVDKMISIRLISDSAKGKDGEADEAIDATLCDIDIYCKKGKQFKSIGQCTDFGGGGFTKGAAAGLSDFRRQCNAVYYVAACVLHAASKSFQNATEKTFGESGMGEEKFQKFL